ncbi:class I SAM-dependent methyltransferase [Methylogaea oryzae]|uniref:SAM-dependent methyltransferase n=1 Tax=Methylogaea oryzae TaxID=1295382 RepID=A0A8D5AGY4_9GAMM|nr:methyltransferase domain-containing protein [Methylogaea oryzae]BBL70888.1 SAM-dependent methyltransferase [Methylogaea oryzae]
MAESTSAIRRRYDRLAPFFDLLEGVLERLAFGAWRQRLWSEAGAGRILEVGVGTGKNFPYHPPGADITAIDFSAAMLSRARNKLGQSPAAVELLPMDVERLDFPDNSFDTVAASFVFCSVPLPVKGLREVLRVCKPGGRVLLLEHVLSEDPLRARIMNWLNPLVVKLVGANINRRTVGNVAASGLAIDSVEDLGHSGLVKLIRAHKPDGYNEPVFQPAIKE